MKVKATISFAGQISMARNEVRDVWDDVAAPLLKCGYLVSADGEAQAAKRPQKSR